MQGNRVGRLGATALASLLRSSSSLRLIDLSNNDIGGEGVKAIAAALNDRSVCVCVSDGVCV